MTKKDRYFVRYTDKQLRRKINDLARRRLNMTGTEAIQLLHTGQWKERGGAEEVWGRLDGWAFLLSDDPRREELIAAVKGGRR